MHAHLAEVRQAAVDAGVAEATREDRSPAAAAPDDADRPLSMNNEQLVYELLHNPHWQLPAPEPPMDEVRRRQRTA
jgi:hypothetical protein